MERVCIGFRKACEDRIVPVFLPPMQTELLKEIAQNETTRGIAFKWKCSPKTVEFHRVALYKSLGVQGTAALTKIAVKLGLTTLDEYVP